jgi:hypothetical protein
MEIKEIDDDKFDDKFDDEIEYDVMMISDDDNR